MSATIAHKTAPRAGVEQVRDYQAKGWTKLPQVLDAAELKTVNAAIAEAVELPEFQPKASGARADQASAEYQKVMRVYRDLASRYPEVEAIVQRLGPVVGELNGWDGTRVWQDRVFIKPGSDFGSRPTNWHQDVKLPFDRRGFATVWIAMVDIPKTRGPMTFLNGSHRLGSLGAIEQLEDNFDLSELLNEHDWAVVDGCATGAPLAAGDATVHSMLTLHRAGTNVDVEDRVVLAASYFDAKQLYNGSPNPVTDGLGLHVGKEFEHESFPLVA